MVIGRRRKWKKVRKKCEEKEEEEIGEKKEY
jgi:hypothetical protein